jgi:Raf kinase inhibitor-like YbhB/YbcL family protein
MDLTRTVDRSGPLTLESPAFDHGERMPDWVGRENANENPPLSIGSVPDGSGALILFMDDPDAAPVVGFPWSHWLVIDIDPGIGDLPRGWEPSDSEAIEAYNDFPERSYAGPAPPSTHDAHTYRFKLFALSASLGLPPCVRPLRVGAPVETDEMELLASTRLDGTYAPGQSEP